jgi:hypothetical protein
MSGPPGPSGATGPVGPTGATGASPIVNVYGLSGFTTNANGGYAFIGNTVSITGPMTVTVGGEVDVVAPAAVGGLPRNTVEIGVCYRLSGSTGALNSNDTFFVGTLAANERILVPASSTFTLSSGTYDVGTCAFSLLPVAQLTNGGWVMASR